MSFRDRDDEVKWEPEAAEQGGLTLPPHSNIYSPDPDLRSCLLSCIISAWSALIWMWMSTELTLWWGGDSGGPLGQSKTREGGLSTMEIPDCTEEMYKSPAEPPRCCRNATVSPHLLHRLLLKKPQIRAGVSMWALPANVCCESEHNTLWLCDFLISRKIHLIQENPARSVTICSGVLVQLEHHENTAAGNMSHTNRSEFHTVHSSVGAWLLHNRPVLYSQLRVCNPEHNEWNWWSNSCFFLYLITAN